MERPAQLPQRAALLAQLAAQILRLPARPCVRVAVDGVDGAGKSVFADELAAALAPSGRPIIRASVDGFHNPRAVRYRRGRASPEGFFLDSYDYAALRRLLLDPLAPGGSGRFRTAAFDHRTDSTVDMPEQTLAPGSILVLDGIFLHRPELRATWDFSIWLQVAFAVSVVRLAGRDGTSADPVANQRYIVGQQLYIAACDPARHATLVVDNGDLAAPFVVPRAA
jgi:uridine kinase